MSHRERERGAVEPVVRRLNGIALTQTVSAALDAIQIEEDRTAQEAISRALMLYNEMRVIRRQADLMAHNRTTGAATLVAWKE